MGSGAAVRDGIAVQAGNGRAGVAEDSETTANLPQISGPADPFLDRNSRAGRGSSAVPAVGQQSPAPARAPTPTRPPVPSALDQYGALGNAPLPAPTGSTATALTGPVVPPVPPISNPSAAPAASTGRRPRRERTPRRARLQIRHFNVWTVFKFSVVLAVALFFVWLIIVAVLYGTLDHLQAIDHVNKAVRTIENDSSTKDAVTPRIVFTGAFLIGLLDIVLFIALTTIGAVVYNLCADLVGGIEVTLAERD